MKQISHLLESVAAITAKKMGLEYYGFGRYGKNNVATHKSVAGVLVPITKEQQDKEQELRKVAAAAHDKEDYNTAWNAERELQSLFKTRDFRVPVDNMPQLSAKIEKLNKRAKKIGQTEIKIVKHGDPLHELVSKGNPHARDPEDRHDKYGTFQYITVEGETPKLNGWSFNGRLEKHMDTVLVHAVPGKEIPLKYKQTTKIECEHCKKNVRRNDTFILQHDNGDHIQVGRSCLKDFLGHKDPGDVAAWAETLQHLEGELSGFEKDEDGKGSRVAHMFPTEEVLALSFASIRKHGGFKPSTFDDSTRSRLTDHFFAKADRYRREEDLRLIPDDEDREKAKESVKWMKDNYGHDTGDFWMNLNKMVEVERVTPKHFGYVSALAGQYEKHLGVTYAKKKQQEGIVDVPLGSPGDRVKFEAEVVASFNYTGRSFSYYDSGVRTVYTMRTTDGKLVKWFASGNAEFKKGDNIVGKGTIKSVDVESYDSSPFKGHTVSTIGRGAFEIKQDNTAATQVNLNSIIELTIHGRGGATKKVTGIIDTFNKKTGTGTMWSPDGMYTFNKNTGEYKVLGSAKNDSDVKQHFPGHNFNLS